MPASRKSEKTNKKRSGAARQSRNSRSQISRNSAFGKRKRDQHKNRLIASLLVVIIALIITIVLIVVNAYYREFGEGLRFADGNGQETSDMSKEGLVEIDDGRPPLDVQLLTPNEFSRPQIALNEINGIVVHYTANPGATAQGNHDYFEALKDTGETHASSHFVIGLDGEIIQCIPSTEISYASNGRNHDTLSIECCHPDDSGKFNDATYQSLVELTAWLCKHFDISPENVIRHYDVTGKNCPKYFVEHEDAWEAFLADVRASI